MLKVHKCKLELSLVYGVGRVQLMEKATSTMCHEGPKRQESMGKLFTFFLIKISFCFK